MKSRYFGKGVAVESCSPPSSGTAITPCPQRSAIPSDPSLKLTGLGDIDADFVHAAFLVHDDELLCTESADEADTIIITFSSLDRIKLFFATEVVPDPAGLSFSWLLGHVSLTFVFTGSIIPVNLNIQDHLSDASCLVRCSFFPVRSSDKDLSALRGWYYPEFRLPGSYFEAEEIVMRSDSDSALVRSLEKSFLTCRGSLAVAVPSGSFVACVIACAGARYGVQLVPPSLIGFHEHHPVAPITQEGDEALGPFLLLYLTSIPLSPSFHKTPMARSIEGKFFFPSMDQVKKFVFWLSGAIQKGAMLGLAKLLAPRLTHPGSTSVSPLWSLLASYEDVNQATVAACNYVHGAIGNHALFNFDLGGKDAARMEAARRFGDDARWQLVFQSNARATYECTSAGGFFTLPNFHAMEALSCTLSGLPAVREVFFTSRLAAALVVHQLSILGHDCTLSPSSFAQSNVPAGTVDLTAEGDGDGNDVMAPVEEGGVGEAKVHIAEEVAVWPPALAHLSIRLGFTASFPSAPLELTACLTWAKVELPDDDSTAYLAALQESNMIFADHRHFDSLAENWDDFTGDLEVLCIIPDDLVSISPSKHRSLRPSVVVSNSPIIVQSDNKLKGALPPSPTPILSGSGVVSRLNSHLVVILLLFLLPHRAYPLR